MAASVKNDSVNKVNYGDYILAWPVFHGEYSDADYQNSLNKLAIELGGVIVGSVVKVVKS